MRRFSKVMLASVVVLGGCDKFSTRSDVVAQFGDDKLTAPRMAEILANLPQNTPPTALAAVAIANLWLYYQLFGDAVVQGKINNVATGAFTIANSPRMECSST